jgi:hypothetical protein
MAFDPDGQGVGGQAGGMNYTLLLSSKRDREKAHRWIDKAPEDFALRMGKATRSDVQNRKMWPMIQDIKRQVPEMAVYTEEQIKLRFLDALGTEMVFLPKLSGEGMFPVGMRSSTLTKAQFGGLLDLLYEYGARHDVKWSDPQEQS